MADERLEVQAVTGIAVEQGALPASALVHDEISLLGYRFHPLSGPEIIGEIEGAVALGKRLVVADANLHAMASMFDSKPMARLFLQPDCRILIDSMPVLFLANLCGFGLSRDKRATSLDFYDDLFRLGAERQWSFAYIGAEAATLNDGLVVLRDRFPGLDIDGRPGFFDVGSGPLSADEEDIVAWLSERPHDVVIVGMGMPRQEEWIERVQSLVPSHVFLTAGAYLDYQVGVQKAAPRWLGQIGLEWAYRLLWSPRRLGYRYLVEPLILLFRLIFQRHPQAR